MPKRVPRRKPASTDEGREKQLVSYAVDLAEKQLLDGSASSQVITHYLKLGSTREALEQERLKHENVMLVAKTESLESAVKTEELYRDALTAMRAYSGQDEDRSDDGEE